MTALAVFIITPQVARAVLGVGDIVSDPIAETSLQQKNIFDQLKYAWEQTQWADNLATIHNTLTTVEQQLQTLNTVKQAIGDPAAAASLIDGSVFSSYLRNSGIPDTLTQLIGITQKGVQFSATIGTLFKPIDINQWTNPNVAFDGIASFRDADDPLARFRAVENAYSQFETLLSAAKSKRQLLNGQIASLTTQLQNAQSDAEVQKLNGALLSAQTALSDLDGLEEAAHQQVELLHVLNQNRQQEETVAAEEISRKRNRDYAQQSAEAIQPEAQIAEAPQSNDGIDFTQPIEGVPPFPGN